MTGGNTAELENNRIGDAADTVHAADTKDAAAKADAAETAGAEATREVSAADTAEISTADADHAEAGEADAAGSGASGTENIPDTEQATEETIRRTAAVSAAAETVTEGAHDGEGMAGADEDADADAEDDHAARVKAENEAIKEKIRERKRLKKRKARLRKIRIWTFLIVFGVIAGGLAFSLSGFFTVDSIDVIGNQHFTAEEIINIAHAVPGHNLLYNTGEKNIIEYLEQNPYIKSASVTRKLPSTLVITVEERTQALAFKYDDDYLIMDDEGILLKKSRTEPKITMVTGLVVTRLSLGERVGTEDQHLFSKLLKLIRATNAGDLYFVSIDMTSYEEDNMVRAYILDKLMVKADYDLLMENLSNGRLHAIVEKLFEDDVSRGTITFVEDGAPSFEPGI